MSRIEEQFFSSRRRSLEIVFLCAAVFVIFLQYFPTLRNELLAHKNNEGIINYAIICQRLVVFELATLVHATRGGKG